MKKEKPRSVNLGKLAVEVIFPKLFNADTYSMFDKSFQDEINKLYSSGDFEFVSESAYLKKLSPNSREAYGIVKFLEVPSMNEKVSFMRNVYDLDKFVAKEVHPSQVEDTVHKLLPIVIGTYYSMINHKETSEYNKERRNILGPNNQIEFMQYSDSYFNTVEAPNYMKIMTLGFIEKPFVETSSIVKKSLYRMLFQLNKNSPESRLVETSLIDSFVKTKGDPNLAKELLNETFKEWVEEYKNAKGDNLKNCINFLFKNKYFGPFQKSETIEQNIIDAAGLKTTVKDLKNNFSWFTSAGCANFYNQALYKSAVHNEIFKDVHFVKEDSSLQDKIVKNIFTTHLLLSLSPQLKLTSDYQALKDISTQIGNNPRIGENAIAEYLEANFVTVSEKDEVMSILKSLSPSVLTKDDVLNPAILGLKNNQLFLEFFIWALSDEANKENNKFKEYANQMIDLSYNRLTSLIALNLKEDKRNKTENALYDLLESIPIYEQFQEVSCFLKCIKSSKNPENSSFALRFEEKYPDLFLEIYKEIVIEFENLPNKNNKSLFINYGENGFTEYNFFSDFKPEIEIIKRTILDRELKSSVIPTDEHSTKSSTFKI